MSASASARDQPASAADRPPSLHPYADRRKHDVPPCSPVAPPSASGMDARQGEDPLAGLRLCRQPGSARRTTNLASSSRWDEQLSFHCRLRGGIRPMVTAGFEVPIRVAKTDQTVLDLRIVIENPVIGVLHSLQARDDTPLDPKRSREGEALVFDFPIRVGPGPKLFGDQVRREGPVRRFVYIRIGQSAGDPSSPWSRRMKIDIHDIGDDCSVVHAMREPSSKQPSSAPTRTARPPAPRCGRRDGASSSAEGDWLRVQAETQTMGPRL